MKVINILLMFSALSFVGCASTNYDVDKSSKLNEVAVIYTLSKGKLSGLTYEFSFKKIDDKRLSGKSSRWLKISSGMHTIELSGANQNEVGYFVGGVAGGLVGNVTAAASVAAAANYGIDPINSKDRIIEMEFQAGKIYVFEPVLENEKLTSIEIHVY